MTTGHNYRLMVELRSVARTYGSGHAAVTWDGKKAQITDLGSSNGTFVRVTGATPIKHGDHVRMGDQLLRIELGK